MTKFRALIACVALGLIGIANADGISGTMQLTAAAINSALGYTVPNTASGQTWVGQLFTSAFGYTAGGGGVITQATSRVTGVTINFPTGDITLVSAAGSVTPSSFTVTDSAIAITDTVIVNQRSGTDLYEIFVTNVAAGSFKITSFTTGGTTTEQPVFNFVIVKGSTT